MKGFAVALLLIVFGFGSTFVTRGNDENTTQTDLDRIELLFDEQEIEHNSEVIVRLYNGDLVTGVFVYFIEDEVGSGVVLQTILGETIIYISQILEIRSTRTIYANAHTLFVIPTAVPIASNHSASIVEIAVLRGSFGLSSYANLHVSRSFIPSVESDQQISNATFLLNPSPSELGVIQSHIALGVNVAFVQDDNRIVTALLAGTFENESSLVTGILGFTFQGVEDRSLRFGTFSDPFTFNHPTGSLTLGIGVDSQISGYHNLRFLSELWFADVLQPSRTMLMGGLRYHTSHFSFDAGMAVFPAPAIVPVLNISYTPGL